MNTNTAAVGDVSDVNAVASAPVVKSTRGRKVDPQSNYSRAKNIFLGIDENSRDRATVLGAFEKELGLKKETASVYFYNIKRDLKNS